MNDREKWRERVRDIRAGSATWWWWMMMKVYVHSCFHCCGVLLNFFQAAIMYKDFWTVHTKNWNIYCFPVSLTKLCDHILWKMISMRAVGIILLWPSKDLSRIRSCSGPLPVATICTWNKNISVFYINCSGVSPRVFEPKSSLFLHHIVLYQ